jgi:outer membrane protein assembly factor BamB
MTSTPASRPPLQFAEILNEYGPFPECERVNGVTFDGVHAWFAAGNRLQSFDPRSGEPGRALAVAADAGTAFDGRFFYQLAADRIQKLDPKTGALLDSIPAPGHGKDSGLTWAEGSLWVGQYSTRKIYRIDPKSGEILRTIESDRFVTGVTWVDGDLWHATWEGEESELRRLDPETGEVEERLAMPAGTGVSGLEADGSGNFFCGGGSSGKVRRVRRPSRQRAQARGKE